MFEKLETSFEKWKDCRNKKSFYQRDIRKKEKKRLSKATKYLENSFVFEKCETSFEEWEDCRNKKSFYLSLSRHCQPTRVIKLFQLCHKKPTSHLSGGVCSSNWFFSCPKTMSWPCPYNRFRNQKINDSQEASDNHKEPGWHFYFRVFTLQSTTELSKRLSMVDESYQENGYVQYDTQTKTIWFEFPNVLHW